MVVKRGRGGWIADWYDERGRRRRRAFKLKTEAEDHEARERARARAVRAGDAPPPAGDPDVTLEVFVRDVFNPRRTAQGVAPGTVERQRSSLDVHILPALGPLRVRAIHRRALRDLVLLKLVAKSRRGGRLSEGTVRHLVATLSAVFVEAIAEGLVEVNPVRGLWRELRRGATAKRNGRGPAKALTTNEAQAFLRVAAETEAAAWPALALMALAGLRAGEAFAVTADRLDLRAGRLVVDRQLTQFGGRRATKAGESRTVELAPQLVDVLAALSGGSTSERVVGLDGAALGDARPRGPYLMAPELPERPTDQQAGSLYRRTLAAMRRALKRAALPGHHGLHALRHTYGSGLVSRGASLAFVRQQMGHASISMTVDVYGSWLPVEQPGAVRGLAEALLGGRGLQMDTREGAAAVNSPGASGLPERLHVLDEQE
jgi:integrase